MQKLKIPLLKQSALTTSQKVYFRLSEDWIALFFLRLPVLFLLASTILSCTSYDPLGRTLATNSTNWAAKADLWVLSHQEPSGLFPYFFDPEQDQRVGEQHSLGQLIAGHRLAILAQSRQKLRAAHERHLAIIEASEVKALQGSEFLSISSDHSLAAQALYLRLLTASPVKSSEKRERAARVARLLQTAWDADDGFPEFVDGTPTRSAFLKRFYTAQAALALIEHFLDTDIAESLRVARAAVNWLEETYPSEQRESFHPSQVPWLLEALVKLNDLTPDELISDRIFMLSDRLLELQDQADFPGRFWLAKGPDYGRPNTVRDAQSTRVLLMALELALDVGDERRVKRYRRGISLALDNLRAHQYEVGGVEAFPNPSGAVGAVRFRYNNALVRLDGVVFSAMAFEHAARLAWQGKL